MEHQPSGLIWNLDNRFTLLTKIRATVSQTGNSNRKAPWGGGQWGLTADDDGRIYYSTGGGENPAFFFQQPPVYGMFDASGQTEANFRTVFPIAPVPDAQVVGGGSDQTGVSMPLPDARPRNFPWRPLPKELMATLHSGTGRTPRPSGQGGPQGWHDRLEQRHSGE